METVEGSLWDLGELYFADGSSITEFQMRSYFAEAHHEAYCEIIVPALPEDLSTKGGVDNPAIAVNAGSTSSVEPAVLHFIGIRQSSNVIPDNFLMTRLVMPYVHSGLLSDFSTGTASQIWKQLTTTEGLYDDALDNPSFDRYYPIRSQRDAVLYQFLNSLRAKIGSFYAFPDVDHLDIVRVPGKNRVVWALDKRLERITTLEHGFSLDVLPIVGLKVGDLVQCGQHVYYVSSIETSIDFTYRHNNGRMKLIVYRVPE